MQRNMGTSRRDDYPDFAQLIFASGDEMPAPHGGDEMPPPHGGDEMPPPHGRVPYARPRLLPAAGGRRTISATDEGGKP